MEGRGHDSVSEYACYGLVENMLSLSYANITDGPLLEKKRMMEKNSCRILTSKIFP